MKPVRRDVIRVSPVDMVVHLVAWNMLPEAAQAIVRLGRQRDSTDLYGHVPAGSVRNGERWRKGLRRLGVTVKLRMVS